MAEGKALINLEFKEGVLEVQLAKEPCNEIGRSMLEALEKVASFCERGTFERHPIRAMITHSLVERGFCAGADLRELYAENAQAIAQGVSEKERQAEVGRFLRRIHAVMNAIDQAPFLTIAMVHGFVFGGGFELALAHDIIVAERSARFAFPELRLGLVPGFGGIPRLLREVGNAIVRDLVFTGRSIGAERAHALGLVAHLANEKEGLAIARRMAEQALRFDGGAFQAAKRFIKEVPEAMLAKEQEIFLERFITPWVQKALEHFVHSEDPMPYLPPPPQAFKESLP
ncbi:MAG: enoyl-CoA hydratase/isomerase family protein [Sandaracinaceae bacterium]|nr:enoyl-CoA hydratase/isomerase family protein [Sandaracinaceae bacterium]MDW8245534.1 enoyl-CoA hydratase/isomerase family protein [Sandaracinaceae bacterium]